ERRIPDRAREDEALPYDRCDVDELLGLTREMAAPPAGSCGAVHALAVDREPVRTVVASAEAPLPAQGACVAIEREDVAPQVLHVDRVAVGDRSRGEGAGEARLRREPEPPAHAEACDVACVDRRSCRVARAREVAVRERP